MPEMAVAMKTGTVAYAKWMLRPCAASDVWIAATTRNLLRPQFEWIRYSRRENHVGPMALQDML